MKKASKFTFIIFLIGASILAACGQAVASTEEPIILATTPTSLLIATQVTATQTLLSPTNTPIPTPADVSIPVASTLTDQPERAVASIDELIGMWLAVTGPDANIVLELHANKQSYAGFERRALNYTELFNYEGGILTWGDMITSLYPSDQYPPNVSTDCINNPKATYEVYVTYRGDQPEYLRFVLVGEDHCIHRQTFLNGQTLTWLGPEEP